MTSRHFIAQCLSFSSFHCLDIMLNRDIKQQTIIIINNMFNQTPTTNITGLATSYGVHSFQSIRCFNNRNKILTAKLLKQDYSCHKLRKTFYFAVIDWRGNRAGLFI